MQSKLKQTSKEKEKKQPPKTVKYQEVVRGKTAREALRAFDCEECRAFLNAVCEGPGVEVFDRDSIIKRCSRHRSSFSPPKTPDGFWELSFADERAARLEAEDGQSEGD